MPATTAAISEVATALHSEFISPRRPHPHGTDRQFKPHGKDDTSNSTSTTVNRNAQGNCKMSVLPFGFMSSNDPQAGVLKKWRNRGVHAYHTCISRGGNSPKRTITHCVQKPHCLHRNITGTSRHISGRMNANDPHIAKDHVYDMVTVITVTVQIYTMWFAHASRTLLGSLHHITTLHCQTDFFLYTCHQRRLSHV